MNLQPHQQRVLVELRELSEKQDALKLFLRTDRARQVEQGELDLLSMQANAMALYAQCLAMRIARWLEEPQAIPSASLAAVMGTSLRPA